MEYLGTVIHEKKPGLKIACQTPYKYSILEDFFAKTKKIFKFDLIILEKFLRIKIYIALEHWLSICF